MGWNFPGGNFLGGNFPGGIFPGGSLMGGNFPGGNFPGRNFPRPENFSVLICVKVIIYLLLFVTVPLTLKGWPDIIIFAEVSTFLEPG